MPKRIGIVLELQRDCLNPDASVGSILRKAKVIASKLDLSELEDWLDNELNGYSNIRMVDLPAHRKSWGSPKFFNPYRGYCPILVRDDQFGEIISTVYLPQGIAALEELTKTDGNTLIYQYPPALQEALRTSMNMDMECSLHFSTNQVRSALDHVRNRVLDWTLELEKRGVVGEDLSFGEAEKREAQAVTNHIYGSNIGVIGGVGGDASVSHQTVGAATDFDALGKLVGQIREASAALPRETVEDLVHPVSELERAVDSKNEPKVRGALAAMVPVLQGAAGNLAASGILAAISSF